MSPGRSITCAHVQDLLDDYRRGKLLPGQRQVIADHLQTCGECAAELAARENLGHHLLKALPDTTAPSGLPPSVRNVIKAASRAEPPRTGKRSSSLLPIMLTAAVLLITCVALFQVQGPGDLNQDSTIAAPAKELGLLTGETDAIIISKKTKPKPEPGTGAPAAPSRELAAVSPSAAPALGFSQPPPAMAPPPPADQPYAAASAVSEDRARTLADSAAPRLPEFSTEQKPAIAAAPAAEGLYSTRAARAEAQPQKSERQTNLTNTADPFEHQETTNLGLVETEAARTPTRPGTIRFYAKTQTTAPLTSSTVATSPTAMQTTNTLTTATETR